MQSIYILEWNQMTHRFYADTKEEEASQWGEQGSITEQQRTGFGEKDLALNAALPSPGRVVRAHALALCDTVSLFVKQEWIRSAVFWQNLNEIMHVQHAA